MVKNFIKRIPVRADNQLESSLYNIASHILETWYDSNLLNAIRRSINPALIIWNNKIGIRDEKPLKLHLGCGCQHFEGYVNIDMKKTRATNIVCDIKKIPYPDSSVVLIESYHVIEHLTRYDLPRALKEWHRLLMCGGKLIIECPDFDEDVKEYTKGNEKRIDSIFGLQRFPGDTHLFGYNFKTLKQMLESCGFKDIQKKEPQDYHAKDEPCLRVEGIKP